MAHLSMAGRLARTLLEQTEYQQWLHTVMPVLCGGQAARGQLLADADGGAMSPLSPGGPASCRRLQELYGFFQTGGPLGRTNTEGQDDLLAQVRPPGSSAFAAPVLAYI